MRRRVWLLRLAAVLATILAGALCVAALVVLRTPARVADADADLRSAPGRKADLWASVERLPAGLTARILGIEDDLAYRRTVALFARLRPGQKAQVTDLEREDLWTQLQFDLITRSREDVDPRRRSVLQNLLGVVALARYQYIPPEEREQVLTSALGSFRNAIELDPENEAAKLNLELMLRLFGPTVFPADSPSTGGARGEISGQGRSGSGY